MMLPENHYQLLGIEPSAPLPSVQSALERLADQANRLAYTSPERSRELWERIRQIRDDLLSGSARRQAYDASLQQSQVPIVAPLELQQPVTSPSRPEAVVAQTQSPTPPHGRRSVPSARTSSRRVPIWPLLVAGGIVALTLVLAFALGRPSSSRARHVTHHVLSGPGGLSASGFRKGAGFVSGKRITLKWRPVTGAALYHLEVAPVSRSGFQHPLLSVLTKSSSYSVKLPGERRYMWRVQALIAGSWSPRARVKSFLVARPGTSAPQLRTPPASSIQSGQVRLCWSSVPWAVAYLLRIQPAAPAGPMIVHGTCQTVMEKPGTYSWAVAGLIRGVRTYTGPFSPVERFTVPQPSTAWTARRHPGLRIAGGAEPNCSVEISHLGCRVSHDRGHWGRP